ncbi:hypothetical protein VTK73DRAFT_3328 [Phialemonium thermophilum]|uniref:MARVEL domain-containing protein n=1 Tax=Phialemonium thermophilum TaxID=223376 RepID=A0ABR3WZU6_9PEZI
MELPQILIRGLQFLWTLLITALIGNVIASNHNGHMAAVNFTMFVAVLSWISVIAGLAGALVDRVSSFIPPLIQLSLDGIAALFSLIDGIVLAALLGAANCGASHLERHHGSGWIGWGSSDPEKRCREIQASTAFVWFLWATVAASLAIALLGYRRMGGSVGSSRPTMSQVHGV